MIPLEQIGASLPPGSEDWSKTISRRYQHVTKVYRRHSKMDGQTCHCSTRSAEDWIAR